MCVAFPPYSLLRVNDVVASRFEQTSSGEHVAKNLSSAKGDMRPLVPLFVECAQRELVTVVIASRSVAVSVAEFRPTFVTELFGISPKEIGTSQRASALDRALLTLKYLYLSICLASTASITSILQSDLFFN